MFTRKATRGRVRTPKGDAKLSGRLHDFARPTRRAREAPLSVMRYCIGFIARGRERV
jgi:hypothetical protein